VSTMTVSRTLNAPGRVRPDTRARVLAAVERLDYRPNQAARQLVTGRSGVLRVVGVDTNLYGPAATAHHGDLRGRRPDDRGVRDRLDRTRPRPRRARPGHHPITTRSPPRSPPRPTPPPRRPWSS
jgi:hypothetical protein